MKKPAGIALVAIVLAAIAAYTLFSPETASRTPAKREFTIVIQDGKMKGEKQKFTAHEGDTVVFRITADAEEEFHLHGYDRSVDLVPNTQVSLTLTANASGRFVFELEHNKVELGALEVMP